MMRAVWILVAALLAVAAAGWSYGRREETVAGRGGPATLRALALFLLLTGFALPALGPGSGTGVEPLFLLDLSRSMALPARAGDPGRSRIDSARQLIAAARPQRVLGFGDEVVPLSRDSALRVSPAADRSQLVPALEAAVLSGAERVVVVSDGEWEDRPVVRVAVARLGLALREMRVSGPVGRVGIAELTTPLRVRAGDSARVTVNLLAAPPEPAGTDRVGGAGVTLPDSVAIELRRMRGANGTGPASDALVATLRVAVPAAGRMLRAELGFVPPSPAAGDPEWHVYEARLVGTADPLGAADRRRFVVEVAAASGGAVLVSTDPDWEPRYLLPRLQRSALGGAVGFLHLGDDRWVELTAVPKPVESGVVRRSASAARLLVVQGGSGSFPDWLDREAKRHPRRLLLPRGAGDLPGTPLSLSGPLPGEWYAAGPPPVSPVSRQLAGLSLETLPPLLALYGTEGASGTWSALEGRRNRRGEPRPLLIGNRRGVRRWAAAIGEGYWRWAARAGAPRRAYDALMTGVAGWLLEELAPRDVELLEPARAGRPLRWSVAPGIADLALEVRDSTGVARWSVRWGRPESGELGGPVLEPGSYTVVARGMGESGAFLRERPLELAADPRELVPRSVGEPIVITQTPRPAREPAGRLRPVWPFVLAALLLCGEWLWRRRIGLR